VLVMGVLYLTLMLGSGVGVRKGGREGKRRHVTPSNTHVLKLAERRYMTVGAWLIQFPLIQGWSAQKRSGSMFGGFNLNT
jgi:hypothetical protein